MTNQSYMRNGKSVAGILRIKREITYLKPNKIFSKNIACKKQVKSVTILREDTMKARPEEVTLYRT